MSAGIGGNVLLWSSCALPSFTLVVGAAADRNRGSGRVPESPWNLSIRPIRSPSPAHWLTAPSTFSSRRLPVLRFRSQVSLYTASSTPSSPPALAHLRFFIPAGFKFFLSLLPPRLDISSTFLYRTSLFHLFISVLFSFPRFCLYPFSSSPISLYDPSSIDTSFSSLANRIRPQRSFFRSPGKKITPILKSPLPRLNLGIRPESHPARARHFSMEHHEGTKSDAETHTKASRPRWPYLKRIRYIYINYRST